MVRKADIRPYTRQFMKGNGLHLFLAVLEIVSMTAANLLITWLIQQIVDLVAGARGGFDLMQLVMFSLAAAGLISAAYLFSYHARPRFTAKAIGQYKNYVFGKISMKGVGALAGEGSSAYLSALSNDTASIEENYLKKIFDILGQCLMFVSALAMMLWYSPMLTAVSLGLSILPVIASVAAGSRIAEEEKKVSACNEEYMSTLQDSLSGFSVVKAFRAEKQMRRLFSERVKAVCEARERREKIVILVRFFSEIASFAVQLGVFVIAAYLAMSGQGVTAGIVMAFVQMMNYVLSPIATIPEYIAQYKAARALIVKLADALERNIREEGGIEKRDLRSGIYLEDLSYGYEEGKFVLKKISFAFEAGRKYALVGASGSGKTTLLNLLMACSHEYEGGILYDDTELRKIGSESLYELVSVVQQNVFIFNASIRENITMFSAFPEEEVDRAIELSGLSPLISERGEEYLCGENGAGLSGGEKQRISIARSLLKKSRVLLADEATAALDAQTAYQVSNAILNLEGMTRIVVTHSLDEALLRRYDCILTLKNGTVAEAGSFTELMERKGYFYSLYTVSQ